MNNFFLRFACLSGALAVVLGAFGTHALRNQLSERIFDAYQTGVLYQFVHTFALALTGLLCQYNHSVWMRRAGISFIIGLILFSGSLYAMALLHVAGIEYATKLGMITPFGGLAFIAGWLCMFFAFIFKPR